MTNQFVSLCIAILAMWMMFAGIAYMVGGPATARAVFVRPVRWAVPRFIRLIRWMVGGILVALGQWIRG